MVIIYDYSIYYTSAKSWRGYTFSVVLCVCVCVCVCVCLSGSACEQNSSRMDEPICTKWLLAELAQTLLKLVTLDQRSRSQWRYVHFSNTLSVCERPYLVSQLSYVRSQWNSVCHLNIPLVDLCLNFIKVEWVMTLLWRHLGFLQTIVHISNSIKPTNSVFGTNT